MIIKKLANFKMIGTLGVLVFIVSVLSSTILAQTSYAWCDQDAGFSDDCVTSNYDSIPDKRNVTFDQFNQLARSCMSGNPTGFDFGSVDEGTCINATTSCIEKSIDLANCSNPDVLADIAFSSNTADSSCDEGKVGGDKDCKRLRDINAATVEKNKAAAEKKASDSCSVTGNETDKKNQREACVKAVSDKCSAPNTDSTDFYNNNKKFNEYGSDQYADCVGTALISTAKNQQECMARGDNIWMEDDTKDPNGPNTLSSGCYGQAKDLTNPEACKAAGKGFEWKQTGGLDTSKPQDDSYGCVDPANPNGEDNNTDGAVTLEDKSETTKNCGQVGTNLIACDGEGVAALGNVLKIFISVLTVLIGIAAIGGLAWASFIYAKAEDNSGEVGNARTLIRNIVIGIMLYGFMVAIINWLVPGGVIGT